MPRTLLWKLLAINLLVVGVAVGVAAVTIGGLVLSVILVRRVVDPVRQMMARAERIAAGDYAARARVGASDEIGRLAESLTPMAGGLQTPGRPRQGPGAHAAPG